MPRSGNIWCILALAGSVTPMATSPAWSQQGGVTQTVQQQLLMRIQAGVALERYLESMRIDFVMVDADSDGEITQRDVDLHTVMEGVQARKHAINMVMRYDLDGDGLVTEDEIRRSMTYDLRAQIGLAAANKLNQPQLPDAVAKQIDNMARTIVALDTSPVPRVADSERLEVNALGYARDGIIHVAAHFGYMETPNVLAALRLLDPTQTEGTIAIDDASYFLSKLELIKGAAPTMAPWRKRLFIATSSITADAADYFGLPPDRTVIMGSRIEV
jgi:Ca2+-binding EF-hand superfamily protein